MSFFLIMQLIMTPPVKELGINVGMAIIRDAKISNRSGPLEKRKKAVVSKLQTVDIANNPILSEYRDIYAKTGIVGHKPPAEQLITLIKKNGRLPNINTVVDCYNLISAETFLSIGAHDTAHIAGDVSFTITDGSERYTPLGETQPCPVSAGEYACMDAEKILCRMDIKQCNETKITKETKAFMVYVQGNQQVASDSLQKALMNVCELITEICGGTNEIVAATSVL
jgi:DNA/RNA-binding domain of Phe-tRNA-synthetase-like protein